MPRHETEVVWKANWWNVMWWNKMIIWQYKSLALVDCSWWLTKKRVLKNRLLIYIFLILYPETFYRHVHHHFSFRCLNNYIPERFSNFIYLTHNKIDGNEIGRFMSNKFVNIYWIEDNFVRRTLINKSTRKL